MSRTTEEIIDVYRARTPKETVEERIQSLDKEARGRATKSALVPGVIGVVLLGVGMSLTMEFQQFFILGIVLGVIGLVLVSIAYPVYAKRLAREREEVRLEILDLANQLFA